MPPSPSPAPITPGPETHLDIRDVLTQLMSDPLSAAENVWRVSTYRIEHRWWQMLIIVAIFALARHWLQRARMRLDHRTTLKRSGRTRRRFDAQRNMLISSATFVTWLTFLLLMVGQLGLSVSNNTLTWVLGSVSLTVAFVVRPYLADALSGWASLAGDRYGIGDYLDFGFGKAGTVTGIDLWKTTLLGGDGELWTIRNSEMDGYANLSQSSGRILTDMELIAPDDLTITSLRVTEWEKRATDALVNLRSTLRDVDAVARDAQVDEPDLEAMAAVVPALVPNLDAERMSDIREIDPDETGVMQVISTAIAQAPVGTTPLFRDIEILGLVTSSPNSVTIRIRVFLVDTKSRSYALAVMRRCLFDAFAPLRIATAFSEVPEGEAIN